MTKQGLLLFDIDGVIRDVTNSYRLAIQETVKIFCNWKPTIKDIDNLKAEGNWNNDWDASLELIKRRASIEKNLHSIPSLEEVIKIFNELYFGGDPDGDSSQWKGFIQNEPLLVSKTFFDELTSQGILWGFVSGAETSSAKFVLEKRLQLRSAPLIAMGDAPEKPNPSGLLLLARQIINKSLGTGIPPIS